MSTLWRCSLSTIAFHRKSIAAGLFKSVVSVSDSQAPDRVLRDIMVPVAALVIHEAYGDRRLWDSAEALRHRFLAIEHVLTGLKVRLPQEIVRSCGASRDGFGRDFAHLGKTFIDNHDDDIEMFFSIGYMYLLQQSVFLH